MEFGRIQRLPEFFGYPLLSRHRVKVWTTNLAGTFIGSIWIKAYKKFGEKGARAYPGTVQVFGVPPIIWGTYKATDFKFCRNIQGVDPNKNPWKNVGNSSRGRSQGVPNIFRAPMYRAHCAVIFAIAQLPCYILFLIKVKPRQLALEIPRYAYWPSCARKKNTSKTE